ncbi:PTS galactosamine/N-acetylgalactosamine transporter subunit IIA [Isobaculum melis]|uniref:PTS system N-acetylgalactosamine-specific EIIA component, Man family n=1 Tax=Isobaculum melis TaxID=142588 RepID=A0A1H9PYR4_9LACT|nr:PTS galactosamine/N-acetylgalactosamine transporter subunit IIA [Isobaculum melis]SER53446.1 PTS system N-acetylgalactosamine-specific EIIA component, Man family [Isobaculum melis]
MIGMVLSGHGNFATGVYSSVQLIAGAQEQFEAIDFTEDLSSEELTKKIQAAVAKVDTGSGVLIVTDIAGGTPFNVSSKLTAEVANLAVVAGTNVAMLLEILFMRNQALETFSDQAITAGINGIKKFSLKKIVIDTAEEGI